MTTMAATAHTYYLARWDRCFGVHADDAELCALLKRQWQLRHPDGSDEPSLVDGFSAWLDSSGSVRICIVRMAAAHMLRDPELERELRTQLAPHVDAPAISESSEGAPEHPPG